MFCEFCGAQINEDDEFCPVCGRKVEKDPPSGEVPEASFEEIKTPENAEIPAGIPAGTEGAKQEEQPAGGAAAVTPDEPKKKGKAGKKSILAICIAACAVLAAALALFLILRSSGSKTADQNFVYFGDLDHGYRYLSLDPKSDAADFLNDEADSVALSFSHSCALIESSGDLYYSDGKDVKEIMPMSEISSYQFIEWSDNYVIVTRDGTLYYYEGTKAKKIGEDGEFGKNVRIAGSSRNGKYVGFVKEGTSSITGYVYNGKKIVELGKNIEPLHISNNGKYLYYTKDPKEKASVRVCRNLNIEKSGGELFANTDSTDAWFVFNEEGDEIFYCAKGDNGYKSYVAVGDKDPVKLASEELYPLYSYDELYALGTPLPRSVIKSFKNRFFYNSLSWDDIDVYYVDSKYEARKAVKHTSQAFIASDGKTILYRDGSGSVYKVNGTKEGAEPEVLVKEDCDSFIPTADGKTIFYINDDDDLMARSGSGKAVPVSDDQDVYFYGYSYLGNECLFKGKTLFYTEDDELYQSSGKKGSKVKSVYQDIQNFSATKNCILVNGEEEILYSKDGKKFIVLYEY